MDASNSYWLCLRGSLVWCNRKENRYYNQDIEHDDDDEIDEISRQDNDARCKVQPS